MEARSSRGQVPADPRTLGDLPGAPPYYSGRGSVSRMDTRKSTSVKSAERTDVRRSAECTGMVQRGDRRARSYSSSMPSSGIDRTAVFPNDTTEYKGRKAMRAYSRGGVSGILV